MEIFSFATKENKDVIAVLKTSETKGISSEDAKFRLEHYGQNSLTSTTVSWVRVLLRQFRSAFIYLLFAASLITYILGEYIDGTMILCFLLINAGLGFYQEYRSERTIELLKRYIVSYVKAVRDGVVREVRSEHIVPGDIIVLDTGDKIPADVRLIETSGFVIDESILTGESVPVVKDARPTTLPPNAYHEAKNLGFSGTTVISGSARAVVLATGVHASIGRISALTMETKRVSNFEKSIDQFANFILKLVTITISIVFLANIFIKGEQADVIELVVFSIALTVSVIPEALPVVTTFSLSRGARRLAEQKVIVKRLSAVEDLGGIEILCSDKTGTLTENKLTVTNVYAVQSDEQVLWYANLAGAFDERKKLEPFDNALWAHISDDAKKDIHTYHKKAEVPFDPVTKKNLVLIEGGGKDEIVVRGAPEAVLAVSADVSLEERAHIAAWIEEEGRKGHRVLAVGQKQCGACHEGGDSVNMTGETGFRFEGVVSFKDPIRASAGAAIKKARDLGVAIKIITGDSREVAGAVAFEIGLTGSPEEVITAAEWEALPQKEQLAALERYAVIARVSPEQKYAVIDMLQGKYVVGFLGEGINDAPALKVAGVSIVVEGGADIAREAADIILLKKNLKTILDGIEEGREVFANTTKYIKATLASNFGNFFAVATASLIVDFLPMLPLQILLVNLLSDFPMIAISMDTVDSKELASPKRYDVKDIVLFSLILGGVSTFFDFIFFGLFYKISPSVLQTNWFIGSILTELILLFSIRSRKSIFKAKGASGTLVWLTSIAAIVTVVLPFIPGVGPLFGFVRPSGMHLAIILGIVGVYFACTETIKLIYYKRSAANGA